MASACSNACASQVSSASILTRWGARTLLHETPYTREHVEALATTYEPADMGAAISSGSFQTDGMIVAPAAPRRSARLPTATGTAWSTARPMSC